MRTLNNLPNWILSMAFLGGLVLMVSCEDEFTEEDAIEKQKEILEQKQQNEYDLVELEKDKELELEKLKDSLEEAGAKIDYAVAVHAGGQSNSISGLRKSDAESTSQVAGAEVTVNQGGEEMTATTNDAGMANFQDLDPGKIVVNVAMSDYTNVTYRTDVSSTADNVSTDVTLFPTTKANGAAVVSGTASVETDLTNEDAEVPEGAVVKASMDLNDYGFRNAYASGSGAGSIEAISYDGITVRDEVAADGSYELVIPTGNGTDGDGLDYDLEVPDFTSDRMAADVNDDNMQVVIDTLSTVYGSNTSGVPALPGVNITVADPPASTGSGFALDAKKLATELEDLGPNHAVIKNPGSGYETGGGSPTGTIEFEISAGVNGNQATISVDIQDGQVENINSFDDDGVSLGDVAEYLNKPTIDTQSNASGNGSGAEIDILFENEYKVFVANRGSGYINHPNVGVTVKKYNTGSARTEEFSNDGDNDRMSVLGGNFNFFGDPRLSDGTNVLDGEITPDFDEGQVEADTIGETEFLAGAPEFDIVAPLKRTAMINPGWINIDPNTGEITNVNVFGTIGKGYDPSNPPQVNISPVDGSNGSGAQIKAEVNNSGEINGFSVTNPGENYVNSINIGASGPSNTGSSSMDIEPEATITRDIQFGTGDPRD